MVSRLASAGPLSPGRRCEPSAHRCAAIRQGSAPQSPNAIPQTPVARLQLGSLAPPRVQRPGLRYPARMRIDEIIDGQSADLLGRVLPAEDRGGDRAAVRDRALAAASSSPTSSRSPTAPAARPAMGTVEITKALKDELGFETMAHLSCVGETTEGLGGDARPDRRRRGSRTSSPCAATRRAGEDGLRPARGRARQRRRARRLHLRRLGLHDRRRLLPRGPPRGARPRDRPRAT